jgi:hypothetical protein
MEATRVLNKELQSRFYSFWAESPASIPSLMDSGALQLAETVELCPFAIIG